MRHSLQLVTHRDGDNTVGEFVDVPVEEVVRQTLLSRQMLRN